MITRNEIMGYIAQGVHKTCDDEAREALFMSGLIGTQWRHYRNEKVYTVVGFSWNGDLDEWCIEYERPYCSIRFNRTLANTFGYIDGVRQRFEQV